MASFEIQDTQDHGKTVVATKRLDPEPPFGLKVFTDEALLIMPICDSENDESGTPPEILEPGPQMWTDWWSYRQKPEDVRKRILDLYVDMDCPHAQAIRTYLRNKDRERQEEKMDDAFDKGILDHIEEFTRFNMVVRFNSVELCPPNHQGTGPGADLGHGLFETACRINHSCKPNCVWITTPDGKAKEVRAIDTIEEGEELTLDYVGETLEPMSQRREELLVTKGFKCRCHRCSAKHDDTRRFRCYNNPGTACQGAHFLVQPDVRTEPRLLDCDQCGCTAPQEYVDRMLQEENDLVEEINSLNHKITDDSAERIEQLKPPHHLHSLAEKCYELKGELYSGRGDYQSAAKAYAKQLECRTAILGDDYHSQASAFCCERIGDALRHINMEEAEEAYKRTVRQISLVRGSTSDPYTKCALEKLLDIQHRLAKAEPDEIPHQPSLDGMIAAVPGSSNAQDYPCDMCGNPSSVYFEEGGRSHQYCCTQHMDLHSPLARSVLP